MDGWMKRHMDRCITDGYMDGWVDGWVGERTENKQNMAESFDPFIITLTLYPDGVIVEVVGDKWLLKLA